ncbi:hypothetical protein CLV76_10965 [Marivita geojedonensis]|nr:hypothetical protein CLV76_10965 [Marivita geojedonensis]
MESPHALTRVPPAGRGILQVEMRLTWIKQGSAAF